MNTAKTTEAALRWSESKLHAIIHSAMDGIITIDGHQRIILFNQAAEKMFRCPAEDALGAPLDQFIPPRFREAHQQHLEGFGKTGVTTRRMGGTEAVVGLRADGEEFPLEASISQIRVGEERLYTVILRDVTERRRAEAELRETRRRLVEANADLERTVAERTAALNEHVAELEAFAYSLSHDMRAPLRAIHSFSSILLAEQGERLDEQGRDYLRRVLRAAGRLDALIQDVLCYSRTARSQIQLAPLDPARLLEQLINENPAFQPPNAVIEVASPLLPVLGDIASLSQCLANLLGNAVKFVAPGQVPRVRIGMEPAPAPAPEPGGRPSADRFVRLYVADEGVGIPAGALPKMFGMFQRFHPRGYEGTGLGLAIVRKAAERMGGRVGVESQPGHGSRFWLELRSPGPTAEAGNPEAAAGF